MVFACRYNLYGDVSTKAAAELLKPATADFFAKLIQRVAPKSYAQAMMEVTVTARFLENFGGDSVIPAASFPSAPCPFPAGIDCGNNADHCGQGETKLCSGQCAWK